jgi:small-conductance mechanosensitive channel
VANPDHTEVLMPLQEWLSGVSGWLQDLRPILINVSLAALLLLVGTVVAGFLERLCRRAAEAALDRAGDSGPQPLPRSPGARTSVIIAASPRLAQSVPILLGRFVYWITFLLFAAWAIEVLGLPVATRVGERLASYLPGAFTGIAVMLVGVIVASLVGGIATAAAATKGTAYSAVIGRAVQGLLLVLAVLVGLEQIGVHGELLVMLLSIFLGLVLGGAALAFGLGARTAVSNIVGSYYVSQNYRVGQTVRVGDFEGRIVRTTATAVILDNRGGQVLVPARLFTEQPSMLLPETS